MTLCLIIIALLFLYLYLEALFIHYLELKMIKLINLSMTLYTRYQYYEKRDYVIKNTLKDIPLFLKIFINPHRLRLRYQTLLSLYPTKPYVL